MSQSFKRLEGHDLRDFNATMCLALEPIQKILFTISKLKNGGQGG